jgi:hypothetical protein
MVFSNMYAVQGAVICLILAVTTKAAVVPAGFKVIDAVVGMGPQTVPLVTEPASSVDYTTACVSLLLICPRITSISLLELDLETTGPINLQTVGTDQMTTTQTTNGAQRAYYIYNYDSRVSLMLKASKYGRIAMLKF